MNQPEEKLLAPFTVDRHTLPYEVVSKEEGERRVRAMTENFYQPPPVKPLPATRGKHIVVSTAGEYGDIVYLMAVLKEQPGGPHTVLLREHPGPHKTSGKVIRNPEVILPLLLSQPYIGEARMWGPGDKEGWISSNFRETGHHGPTTTLVQAHCRHGMSVPNSGVTKLVRGHDKWLEYISPHRDTAGRVLVARTERWRSPWWEPTWRKIVETYGQDLLFLGMPEEHRQFQKDFGGVEYWGPTRDLLESAQMIAGCQLWISNQTSLYAIAEGLKKPRILEVSHQQTDCIYTGGDVQWSIDGAVHLPDGKEGFVIVESSLPEWGGNIHRGVVPPGGGWKAEGLPAHPFFGDTQHGQVRQVMQKKGCTLQEAEGHILSTTREAHPDWFPKGEREDLKVQLKTAYEASLR